MTATIEDVRKLGYTIGIAHGAVVVEQQALDDAKAAADPSVIAAQADQITTATVQTLDARGLLPETPEERLKLATDIAEHALNQITTATSEKVAFHERALQIAKDSPDVHVVQHFVDGQLVAQLYVACKDDGTGWDDESQAQLDALNDKSCFDERVFQAENPDAMAAAQQLRASGADVTREPGATSFIVDGKTLTLAKTIAAADALP